VDPLDQVIGQRCADVGADRPDLVVCPETESQEPSPPGRLRLDLTTDGTRVQDEHGATWQEREDG